MIISLLDYTPMVRYDGLPWTHARIEEAADQAGPWTTVRLDLLAPVDTDPENPLPRSFTFESDLVAGWYRIVFIDAQAEEQAPTTPVQNAPWLAWQPSLVDVAAIDMARTRDSVGNELETYTADTRPTGEQVSALIDMSMDEIRPEIGSSIPADLVDLAKRLVALRTAMYIELTYFGSEVAQNRSPYPYYKTLFDELLPKVVGAVAAEEAGADTLDAVSGAGGKPAYEFPTAVSWLEGKI